MQQDWNMNRTIGWSSMALGAATGLVMGMWSFAGPVPVPEMLGEYDAVPRRLARLGHIAFFGLGILNLLLARDLSNLDLDQGQRRVAAWTMNFGNIFLPLTLFAAAAWQPLKYTMPLPAISIFVAMAIAALGAAKARRRS
jgi:hypothetical protein